MGHCGPRVPSEISLAGLPARPARQAHTRVRHRHLQNLRNLLKVVISIFRFLYNLPYDILKGRYSKNNKFNP
ncbi:protein of unknown function [Nitrospina watsonii]|uniref:Uncharacterized protein n=1 Tax=Nitrospina watsonii TaxID=1323948 RepID=A0ABM9HGC7_9BACT|nr:protein of unknown function [Nitrospina watsonii]